MQTKTVSSRQRLPMRTLVLNEKILLGTVLALFFVLHVLAGAMLQRAEAEVAVSNRDLSLQLYD